MINDPEYIFEPREKNYEIEIKLCLIVRLLRKLNYYLL